MRKKLERVQKEQQGLQEGEEAAVGERRSSIREAW